MKEINSKNIEYLGVRVDYSVNQGNIEEIIFQLLKNKKENKIYTINPEFIVDAHFDTEFRDELNTSDLNIIDGVGLLYGIKTHFNKDISQKDIKMLKTFTGVDLTYKILEIANNNSLSLFVLGGSSREDVSKIAVDKIKKIYPKINIIGNSSDFNYSMEDDNQTLAFIHQCMEKKSLKNIDILLVGYGHKRQEFWINRNASKIPARISIGVGGTLDYIAGKVVRAPKFIRKLGLEWLFRLVIQPKRILRILKATLIFSYLSSTLFLKKNSKKV